MTESELASVISGIVPVVREHITKALTDLTQRVIAAEARLSIQGDLRDRVVALETKAAMPVPVDPAIAEMRERMSVLEVKGAAPVNVVTHEVVAGLCERIAVVESKSAQPVELPEPEPIDLTPLLERMAAVDARLEPLDGLRDRVITLEAKAAVPVPVLDMGLVEARIAPLQERQKALEATVAAPDSYSASIAACETEIGDLTKDVSALRDRLAAVEVKGLIQGPPGPAGKDGKDGRDGRDGIDGMTLDDLTVEQERERTAVFRGKSGGGQVRELGRMSFPFQIYRDVWRAGNTYERGDCVTRDGSQWHCNVPSTTATPGDGSKDWTLVVKKGRDGRDLRDVVQSSTLPVVRAGSAG